MSKFLASTLVTRTPLLALGPNVYGKAESLQTRGSYKIRGVVRALEEMPPEELARGVATVSAGNLGQSLAYVAQALEIPCTVFVSDSAPEVKKSAIRSFGARLIELPFAEIWMLASRPKESHDGMKFVHPGFDRGLQRGYGSLGAEILEDLPDVEVLVIPYGLGGLTLGVARRVREIKPGIRIYACEIEGAAPLQHALSGARSPLRFRKSKLVDAIGSPEVIPEIFDEVAPLLEGCLVVTEEETASAMRLLHQQGLVVEGAAAVAYAAARKLSESKPEMKICCILSGRNIDREMIQGVLSSEPVR